ncbi:Type II secretion system protein D precursor [Stratiformator vulcanicus]|uniref:Type II secretion system protein D n=2 Tax=Stratiformator vulcanicus TaxID=2527980 RepID=A0A517R038_9PLAN|nr:Type II secretion system protein D precursor [Stratiformator vulcanicus]
MAFAVVFALASAAFAQETGTPNANEPVVRLASRESKIQVIEQFSKIVKLDDRISRVDGFDSDVVDIKALDARSIRLHAINPGVTTLTMTDENSDIYTVEVLVTGDVRYLQVQLNQLFPGASVEAREVNDSVLLRGWVTHPEQITQMVEIAERFYPSVLNHMRVGAPQQVMMKVKIMEVQRSLLRAFGINWLYSDGNGLASGTTGSITPITQIADPDTGAISPLVAAETLSTPNAIFSVAQSTFAFTTFIEALKQESLLKILAEPNLVATNGRPAYLLQGGEFPILVPNGLGTVGVEFREFGVRLEAVPIVLGHNQVSIQLQAEVSDRDFNNAVDLNGITVPALTTRRANTEVKMGFGETLVIAGLINNGHTATTSKIPILGDLPYIGAVFSRKRYTEGETELIIMVTPELVAPMQPGQVPTGGPGMQTDTPTDKELFFYGQLEVPTYGGPCGDRCRDPAGVATEPGMASPTMPQGLIPPGNYQGSTGYQGGSSHHVVVPPGASQMRSPRPAPSPAPTQRVAPQPPKLDPIPELNNIPPSPSASREYREVTENPWKDEPALQPASFDAPETPSSASPRQRPGLITPGS